MQKLYSMFPAGPPGVALLLLRLSVTALLFIDRAGHLWWPESLWLVIGSVLATLALAAGVLTPFFALLCGVLELASLSEVAQLAAPLVILDLVLAAAVALLGPGAYSIDARLYGRRVVLLPPDR